MRLTPNELLLANLKGEIHVNTRGYMPKSQAHRELVRLAGEDFGENYKEWEEWIQKYEKNMVFDPEIVDRVNKIMDWALKSVSKTDSTKKHPDNQ
jgi:hypothetical protein